MVTRAVLLTLIATAGCVELRPPDELCPPGRGPLQGASPQQLAMGENHPVAIAVSGGALFWANQGPPDQDAREGSIVHLAVCDGVQRIIARGQSRPTRLVVDGGIVYWVNAGMTNRSGELWRAALDAPTGQATRLTEGEARPAALAVDATHVYWANQGDLNMDGVFTPGTGSIRRLDKAMGAVSTLAMGAGLDAPSAIALSQGAVLFTNAGTGALVDIDPANGKHVLTRTFAKDSGSVMRLDPARDARPAVLAGGQDAPFAVAADAERVYWVNRGLYRGTGGVLRSDGPPIAAGLDFPSALALDGQDIYVAVTGAADELNEGHVVRERIGEQPVELAAGQQLPNAITVDQHRVYWASFGELQLPNGTIWTRGK